MPTRVLLAEKEKAKISGKKEKNFLFESDVEFMMGSYYKIIEKTEDKLSVKEGKVFLREIQTEGEKKLVTQTIVFSVGSRCQYKCGLFDQ